MNQEELALFIELQPRLLEYRGEWQVGDRAYHKSCGEGIVVEVWPDELVLFFSSKAVCGECHVSREDAVYLPLPIDPADPERIARGEKPRGVWGMVDWDRYNLEIECDGTMLIYETGWSSRWAVPTLALLRALKSQWKA